MKEEHLAWAFTQIKPSAMREILVEVPDVRVVNIFSINCRMIKATLYVCLIDLFSR